MNPIGSANKYINLAMEEYGIHDYEQLVEQEDQFGGAFDVIASVVSKHGGKVVDAIKNNPETASGLLQSVSSSLSASKSTTKKGERGVKAAERKFKLAKAAGNAGQAFQATLDKKKSEMQVILGEMRRQVSLSGVVDPDLQLEIIRNAFAKMYFDKKASPNANAMRTEIRVLKKSIIEMDKKLYEAFQAKNAMRAQQGLPPLVAGFGVPTIEYRV